MTAGVYCARGTIIGLPVGERGGPRSSSTQTGLPSPLIPPHGRASPAPGLPSHPWAHAPEGMTCAHVRR